ncbi:MAG: hypothetical protein J07HQX50_00503 [Haloquadratum sp. J07HQX50]|nr:MAG: hypothetical protein J07HQX50_00503 [Haloquadratum sp. J07HQX50]
MIFGSYLSRILNWLHGCDFVDHLKSLACPDYSFSFFVTHTQAVDVRQREYGIVYEQCGGINSTAPVVRRVLFMLVVNHDLYAGRLS